MYANASPTSPPTRSSRTTSCEGSHRLPGGHLRRVGGSLEQEDLAVEAGREVAGDVPLEEGEAGRDHDLVAGVDEDRLEVVHLAHELEAALDPHDAEGRVPGVGGEGVLGDDGHRPAQ